MALKLSDRIVRTEYRMSGNVPVVYVFTRDERGNRKVQLDSSLRPYFYVREEAEPIAGLAEIMQYCEVRDGMVSVTGEPLKKIEVQSPSDVAAFRDAFSTTYEADILFPNRYLIDRVGEIVKTKLRVAVIDIEVDSVRTVPDPMVASEQVICVTVYDSFEDTYFTTVFRRDQKHRVICRTYEGVYNEVTYVSTEKGLMSTVYSLLNEIAPDVLTGWNMNRFDMMYLINRGAKLGLDCNTMSPMGHVYLKHDKDVVIKGVACVDLLEAYRHFTFNVEESYMLGAIAQKVLGKGKNGNGSNIREVWQKDLQKLIDYNLNDVILTKGINDKRKLIDFCDEIRRFAHCQIEDSLAATRTCDSYILHMFHGRKAFPTKQLNPPYQYEGALVQSWSSGLYDWVYTFDLKSLYPSIIVSLNLSPETVHNESGSGRILVGKTWVDQHTEAYMPEVVKHLFTERKRYKDLCKVTKVGTDEWKLYDNRQFAVKVLLNSLYGQTAYVGSRFYDPRVAEATTYVGRQIVQWSRKVIEGSSHRIDGVKVLYSDTDSIYWSAGRELSHDEIMAVRKAVNDSYDEFVKQYGETGQKHIFSMEYEKTFRKAFFAKDAKKRYAGHCVFKSEQVCDELEIVGLEVKRSDSSRFSRNLQKTLLDMVLRRDKTEDEVCQYVRGEIERLEAGDFEFSEIGIPKGINKQPDEYKHPPINVRAYEWTEKNLGLSLSTKPKMLYVAEVPGFHSAHKIGAISFDEDWQVPDGTKINVSLTLEKTILSKLDGIFDSLDWDLGKIKPRWRQKHKLGKQMAMEI